MKRLIVTVASAAVLLPVVAHAHTPVRAERVSVSDIRHTPRSLKTAEGRIEAAARRVCDAGDERRPAVRAVEARCEADARGVAMGKLERRLPLRQAVTVKVADKRVSLRDLDLAQRQGLQRAEQRLAHAAGRVCETHGVRDLRTKAMDARCADDAFRVARADLERATRLAARGRVLLSAAR